MSITTTPSRVFRTALQRMRRNGWHTVAALSVMTLTFFILSLFVLTGLATSRVLNYFEQQPQVQIYLKDDAPQEKIDELKAELEATNLAKTVHYTSKEEALAFFKEEMKDNPMLLENVSANVLPASIEVSPKNLDDLPQLVSVANGDEYKDYIEEVSYQRDITERLSSWTSTGRVVGLILVAFLVVVSLLIMLVTIGVNISTYKDEVEIMRLVGASSWYIQGPFILEGILYGIFASILSVSIVYLSLPWVAVRLQEWLSGINIFPIEVIPVFGGLLLAEMAFGVILGIIGSWLAMRRSLKI